MSKENAVVIFNGARQHSFSARKDCLVTLNAGKNVVSISKLERLTGETGDDELDKMKSESFCDMIDTGEIEILDEAAVDVAEPAPKDASTGIKQASKEDKIQIDITKLGAKEAITVINAEPDAAIVMGYLVAEEATGEDARKTVVKAANDAITALEGAEAASTGDGDDDDNKSGDGK